MRNMILVGQEQAQGAHVAHGTQHGLQVPDFPMLTATLTFPIAIKPLSKSMSMPRMENRMPKPVRPRPICIGGRATLKNASLSCTYHSSSSWVRCRQEELLRGRSCCRFLARTFRWSVSHPDDPSILAHSLSLYSQSMLAPAAIYQGQVVDLGHLLFTRALSVFLS